MKFNKWTVALAATGLVSLSSIVQAEESSASVMTALSSTTLSGYVDTSAHWNIGTGNDFSPPYSFGGAGKADGFNLNVVKLVLEKPIDASDEWAAGYKADLIFGPDANALATQSSGTAADFGVKQAYVALHTPVGNGLDFKMGVWDTIIGYEVFESGSNPNYTRSYGYTIEPTTHTGLLGSYKVCDALTINAGVANTFGPTINDRANPPKAESYKAYMASVVLTAPECWGFLAGSTFSGGVINGFSSSLGDNLTHYYAGATLNTPVTGLRVGAAFDLRHQHSKSSATGHKETWVAGGYASYQVTEKLGLHLRGEFVRDSAGALGLGSTSIVSVNDSGTPDPLDDVTTSSSSIAGRADVLALTGTLQYDLWKNVISRLEVRWDHGCNGRFFGGAHESTSSAPILTGNTIPVITTTTAEPDAKNEVLVALNIIYKF